MVRERHSLLEANSAVLVLISIGLALFEHVLPWGEQLPARGISSVGVWVVICGLLLPQTPLRSLATGLSAAAMGPVAHYTVEPAQEGLGLAPFVGFELGFAALARRAEIMTTP